MSTSLKPATSRIGRIAPPAMTPVPGLAGRSSRRGKSPHPRRSVGLRRAIREQLLDLPLRLVPCGLEQLCTVLAREHRHQPPRPRQVKLPRPHPFQQLRKLPHPPRHRHALIGHRLRITQHLDAVPKQRVEAALRVELPRVDLGEVRQHIGLDPALTLDQRTERVQKRAIR